MIPAGGWKWKWSNSVLKSEMGIFWCISITNNVKLCKTNPWKGSNVQVQCFCDGTLATSADFTEKKTLLFKWLHTGQFKSSKVSPTQPNPTREKLPKTRSQFIKIFWPLICPDEEMLNPKRKWKKNSQKILAPFILVKMAHWEKGC